MTTQTEYALMSANVYGNYPDTGGTNPVRSGNNTLPVPTGWTQIGTPDYKQNTPSTGFMASVYTSGNEVVISYCGTTDQLVLGQPVPRRAVQDQRRQDLAGQSGAKPGERHGGVCATSGGADDLGGQLRGSLEPGDCGELAVTRTGADPGA